MLICLHSRHRLALLALLAGLCGSAGAAERITWLMPEFVVTEGNAAKGQPRRGMAEPLAEYLKRHWPEPAEHQNLLANAKRSWIMIEAGEQVCHLTALRTPDREAKAVFYVTHLAPPAQLVAMPETMARLPRNSQGEVQLTQVMQEGKLHGAMVQGRSYGLALDALLAQRPAQAVAQYSPIEFGTRLLQMVALGRADYTLEYDFALALQREQLPQLQVLTTAPVQGASEMVASGVACPRNDWGRAMIAKVEKILYSRDAITMLRNNFDLWLTPDARRHYATRLDAFYAERLRNAPP